MNQIAVQLPTEITKQDYVHVVKSMTNLPEEDMVQILKEALTCWQFEKLCKTRLQAYNEKYKRTRPRLRGTMSKALTPTEVMIWKSYMDDWVADAADLMLFTCSGISELWNMEVVEEMGMLRIRRQKTRVEKIIPLLDFMKPALMSLPKIQSSTTGYLHKCMRMARKQAADDGHKKFGYIPGYTKKTKVGRGSKEMRVPTYLVTPHSFRHTATQALGKVVDCHPVKMKLYRGDSLDKLGSHGVYLHGMIDPLGEEFQNEITTAMRPFTSLMSECSYEVEK